MLRNWSRQDRLRAVTLLGVIAIMHLVAFGVLFGLIAPHGYRVGSGLFGVGLGITVYTFGLRHGLDADHIAAIDNTTRKLMADGTRPTTVGFWFALGHSTIVFAMAALVASGARVVGTLVDDHSTSRQTLGMIGTLASGAFLYVLAAMNIVALLGIRRVFRKLRRGEFDHEELETALAARGFLVRILGPVTRSVRRPLQMYPVGMLFGLGFDTATEVALFAMAGSGAAAGLPWYAILLLPLIFASGMCLTDTLDGLFMNVAYDWAFADPIRKVYYNLAITGLSVAVALFIGSIELIGVLHDRAGFSNPVTNWISSVDIGNAGIAIVALFVLAWAIAVGYWKLTKADGRWTPEPGTDVT